MQKIIAILLINFVFSETDCLLSTNQECDTSTICIDPFCKECYKKDNYCISCQPEFYNHKGTCLSCDSFGGCLNKTCSLSGCYDCLPGLFQKQINTSFITENHCLTCDKYINGCSKCTQNSCAVCQRDFVLVSFKTTITCLKCPPLIYCEMCSISEENQQICYHCHGANQFKFNCPLVPKPLPIELKCSQSNCLECSFDFLEMTSKCRVCEAGYILGNQNECERDCGSGQFFDGHSCKSCSDKFTLCEKCTYDRCLFCSSQADFINEGSNAYCICQNGLSLLLGSCHSTLLVYGPICFFIFLSALLLGVMIKRWCFSSANKKDPEAIHTLSYLSDTVNTQEVGIRMFSFKKYCVFCGTLPGSYSVKKCKCVLCKNCFYLVILTKECQLCNLNDLVREVSQVSEHVVMLRENNRHVTIDLCSICLSQKPNVELSCGNKHKLCLMCFKELVKARNFKCHLCRCEFEVEKCCLVSDV